MITDTVSPAPSHIMNLPIGDKKDLEDAWAMLPTLFRIMDMDESGSLDYGELLNFLRRFTAARKIEVNPQKCIMMVQKVRF